MIIDCISDLHGFYPKLEGGDLLIIAGDLTAIDKENEYLHFGAWLSLQNYKRKILISGNHDNFFVKDPKFSCAPVGFEYTLKRVDNRIEYLCDSGTEFEGLKIWGSPWTKTFEGMNPKCKAFTLDTEEELASKFSLIPDDIDILITHSPPYGILDGIPIEDGSLFHVGSFSLLHIMERIQPKLHVFGHIHEQGGKQIMYKHFGPNTWCINCSYVNEYYKPVNKPVRLVL